MVRHLRLLLALVCLAGLLPLVRPQIAPAAQTAAPAASALIALPGSCGGGLPPGANVPVCCMFGYVFIDGQAVEGAKVTIISAHGKVETWTATGPDSPQPYYRTSLSAAPLSAQAGDSITIEAQYSGHSHTVTHTVLGGGQQVDVVLPRKQADDYTFDRQIWGQAEAGKFNRPSGVAVDGAGRVYVTDVYNARVQVFTADGTFLQQWGTFGDQPGQLAAPRGIAVDQRGNVYVADSGNYRIQKFTSTGTWLKSWGDQAQFSILSGIAVDRNGNVYVADQVFVKKFDSEGRPIGQPWGGAGTALGKFQRAEGIAVDRNGNVYVSDGDYDSDPVDGNHRIQKFDSNGNPITQWGGRSIAREPGKFLYPAGVAVDDSGNVYVADGTYQGFENDNHRIQKFDSNGNFITQWPEQGGKGSGIGQFIFPDGVAVDSAGNVYVADGSLPSTDGNHRIQKFDSAGNPIGQPWGSRGLADGQFSQPGYTAVDSGGNLYVVDTLNHRVQKFDSAGSFLRKWGGLGGNPGQFYLPAGIAIDNHDHVYVVDLGNNRVQEFDSEGNLIRPPWGSFGSGNGQFNHPAGIAVDSSDNLYVVDPNNNRVQKFTSTGGYIRQWNASDSGTPFNHPTGIAVDAAGYVYVTDTGNNGVSNDRVVKFDRDGNHVQHWGGPGTNDGQFNAPGGIATDGNGNVYVADGGNYRIQKFTGNGIFRVKWGSQGVGKGRFYYPYGVTVDQSGKVYVGDVYNNRIQTFRPMTYTRPIATIVQATPRSVSPGQAVILHGRGGDSDATPAIAAYEWTLDGSVTPFATTANPTLATATLTPGAHTIRLRVRDTEGEWSDRQSVSISVSGPQSTAWTFLLYLDGDNADIATFLSRDSDFGALHRLEQTARNPNVRVVALYDGPRAGGGDSFYYVQQPDGTFGQQSVNAANEVNMGDPGTLIDFVRWGMQQAPAQHYYLALADHANGLAGIAWDYTSDPDGDERLDNAELRLALDAITGSGAHPLDVLHLDGCLMGLLESAYQLRGQARYLISSENLAWGAFSYERYRAAIGPQTSALELARTITDRYAERVGEDGNPYTIAALDLSQVDTVATRTDVLASELLRYSLASAANRTTLATLRAQAQAFDSTGDYTIAANDEYIDLEHWAAQVQSRVPDTAVQSAAAALRTSLPALVVREQHLTGSIEGQLVNLDQAHGMAIYYPRQQSMSTYEQYVRGGLTFPTDTRWDEFLAAALAPLPLGPGGAGPGPVAPLPLRVKVYLPITRR
jgi:sugar lactone lactonase YvrE